MSRQATHGQPAVYNATPPTLTDGDNSGLSVNANQSLRSSLTDAIAGEDVINDVLKTEQRFTFAVISTATTTTVKSGAGFLHRLIVTGGTAGTIVVYDNTAGSGTQIANFDSTNAIAPYEFNVEFTTGLTIVTGAATKITVAYR